MCFYQDNFAKIESEKSGNAVKTVCGKFSKVKIHAVFARKSKYFSHQYDRKFTPSYTTTGDVIICPGKWCSQSHFV